MRSLIIPEDVYNIEKKNVALSAWPVNQRINEPAVHLKTAVSYFSVSQLILSLKSHQAPGKSNL